MMERKKTKHIDSVVSGLLQRLEAHKVKKANAVREAWREAVSKKALGHTQPVSFKNNVIMVIVENSSWLYELTMEKKEILKKFNKKYSGRKKARDIRFRVGKIELNI